MEKKELFKRIQQFVSDVPLLLIGSGSSASYGIPGMDALGQHLIKELSELYFSQPNWLDFRQAIDAGANLETALSHVVLPPEIIENIRKVTWQYISQYDISLYYRLIFNQQQFLLANLLQKFYQAHPQAFNIITTNYDRVIEYACDIAQIPVCTGFRGQYIKRYSGEFGNRKTVNLIKVHGSLDFFKNIHGETIALPLQQSIPNGLTPDIVTPGISKYEAVLKGTERQLLNECDIFIRKASSYLCIGYGFNDDQIQENIISEIRRGKPIISVTKTLSDRAASLLAQNAKKYITIQRGKDPNTSEFSLDGEITVLEGEYWSVDGLLRIID